MKKRIILFTSVLGVAYLALSSYNAGPASPGNINGINLPGTTGMSTSTCSSAGCHTSGTGTTTATLEIRRKSTGISGPIVTNYYPDTLYSVTIKANNTAYTNFGFQLAAANITTNATVGTFSLLPTDVNMVVAGGGKTFIEHNDALAGMSSTFDWTAPPAGTGTVKFYYVVNAVNNDGQVSGDKPSGATSISLIEGSPASVEPVSADLNVKTYPNPVTDQLNIELNNADNGTYAINVFDMNGKVVATKTANVNKTFQTSINTSSWAAGMYLVQLSKDGAKKTIAVVKQ